MELTTRKNFYKTKVKESEEASLKIGENLDEFITFFEEFRKSQIDLSLQQSKPVRPQNQRNRVQN